MELFCPASPRWRAKTIADGLALIDRAAAGLISAGNKLDTEILKSIIEYGRAPEHIHPGHRGRDLLRGGGRWKRP